MSQEVDIMEKTGVQKLAKVLRVCVIVLFVCVILAMTAVPRLLSLRWVTTDNIKDEIWLFFRSYLAIFADPYDAVLALFLWVCGVCAANILWQGKRVLENIIYGAPFHSGNAVSLNRAAVSCFVISAAALARLIWGFFYYKSVGPLLTYNALFVPVFLVGGLLFLVMSALFRQAAELKAENDLTI